MKKLWLIFAQAVTVCVAALFVITTLKPTWVQLGGAKPAAPLPQIASPAVPALDAPRPSVATAPIASFADAAAKSSKAVVNVFTKQRRSKSDARMNDPFYKFFFGDKAPSQPEEGNSLGSGVIVSTDDKGMTMVITNNHVVEGADAIELVLTDGRRVQATVVGTDPETDLAVLRVQLDKAPVIEWGNIADLRVGDAVLAVGNPFGVGQTVTQGIVSALGRNHVGINTFENFIQTDAAINPGNSGGALTDSVGRLIGINTAIYSKDGGSLGIGFAIPVTTVKQIMDQLLKSGTVTRGYIGVGPEDVNEKTRAAFNIASNVTGCLLVSVQDGSPAAKGGLQKGDVVQAINGVAIGDRAALLNAVAGTPPNSVAAMQVWRAGKAVTVNVTVGTRPQRSKAQQE
jgi:serine protease DegQ